MFYVYISIMCLCLVASLMNVVTRQRFLWIYFGAVFFLEVFVHFGLISRNLYHPALALNIVFFLYYFYSVSSKRLFVKIIFVVLLFFSVLLLVKSTAAGIDLMAFQSTVYTFLALQWLVAQTRHPDEIPIQRKVTFWISSGILVWSGIFLLRILPGNYLERQDVAFLQTVSTIYKSVTIFSYLLILRGLFLKNI